MTKQQQFASKVSELIKQSRSLAPKASKQVIDMLEEAKKQILGEVAGLDPKSFTFVQRTALKSSIDRALAQFRVQATESITALQQTAAQTGIAIVDAPLAAAGVEHSLGQVSQSVLKIAQGYTADLVTGLSAEASSKVNAALSRSFLGGQSIGDIIGQVSKAIGADSPIADRAMTIADNEILRVQSIATQARMEDLADRHPGLGKEWLHINVARVPRIGHIIASGQVRAVNEPFDVEGEELMYPRDPNGSAENTINCHCLSRPTLSDEAFDSTVFHKGILDSLGISVEVA